jgi:hypothetical protein
VVALHEGGFWWVVVDPLPTLAHLMTRFGSAVEFMGTKWGSLGEVVVTRWGT